MIVEVAVPYRLHQTFHYQMGEDLAGHLAIGGLVQVPFRNRSIHAFVLGFPKTSPVKKDRLRNIDCVLQAEPIFAPNMLKLLNWIASYYCHPIGEVLATAVPKNSWIPASNKQRKKKLPESGIAHFAQDPPILTEEQKMAVARILDERNSLPVLLHGVTGSGKTEVYMKVLEETLNEGRSSIVLVPEIALTPQLLSRFSNRFPRLVAVLHSDLSIAERKRQWNRVLKGDAKVVVGARSAIFAPVKDLGLIVVDEEHETSFKQEDHLRYHARDVAIVRAKFESARIILGSATPSLESFSNTQQGKYLYVTLKSRVHHRPLPSVTFVDMREKENSSEVKWLSRTLLEKMEQTLANGRQTLLYLNRLGFARFLFCEDCGFSWRCTNCDVALTYYLNSPRLKCHYCGVDRSPPNNCEQCHGLNLVSMGFGTEQIEGQVVKLFPNARVARLDRSVVKTREQLESVLSRVASREIDILVGTQMIAKGHDFPGIALVGILMADASLNLPDFRSYERTFQVVTQVSGRAGRFDTPGEVVIQTLNPRHPVLMAAAENRIIDFYNIELGARKRVGFPPFARMALLRFQHPNSMKVENFARWISREILQQISKGHLHCELLGPSQAPIAKVKKLFRWQCLLRGTSPKHLHQAIGFARQLAEFDKRLVQLTVDMDPITLS